MKEHIQTLFGEGRKRFATNKIAEFTREMGLTRARITAKTVHLLKKRISRLMKKMELVCTSAQKGIRYNFTPKGRYYRNRLKQKFQQAYQVCTPTKGLIFHSDQGGQYTAPRTSEVKQSFSAPGCP